MDHTVPWAIANASYKRQKRNPSVTEIKKMPNRGVRGLTLAVMIWTYLVVRHGRRMQLGLAEA